MKKYNHIISPLPIKTTTTNLTTPKEVAEASIMAKGENFRIIDNAYREIIISERKNINSFFKGKRKSIFRKYKNTLFSLFNTEKRKEKNKLMSQEIRKIDFSLANEQILYRGGLFDDNDNLTEKVMSTSFSPTVAWTNSIKHALEAKTQLQRMDLIILKVDSSNTPVYFYDDVNTKNPELEVVFSKNAHIRKISERKVTDHFVINSLKCGTYEVSVYIVEALIL